MAIRQVITFAIRAGEGAAFAEGFAPIIAAVRNEPGCEQYELFRSEEHPDRFVMLERWSDQASLDAALKRLYKGPDHPSAAFLKHIEGPPLRERFDV